jgi:hypothetical protein
MAAILLWTGVALDMGVLVGLFVRGRWREAWLLPVVIAAFLVSATTVGLCPGCNTWTFWLAKEFVHATLMLLLGLELTVRAFPPRASGRQAALACSSVVVLASAAFLVTTPAAIDVLPRLIACALCLYAGLTLVMASYGLSLGALHDGLLYGFPVYLIFYVGTWGFTGDDTRLANLVSPLVFNFFMLNLLCVAWQREEHALRPFALAACVRRLWRSLRA